jgi:hypothetical protein
MHMLLLLLLPRSSIWLATSELHISPNPTPGGTKKMLHREELARLAFTPQSPYANDKNANIPFYGVGRIDLDWYIVIIANRLNASPCILLRR